MPQRWPAQADFTNGLDDHSRHRERLCKRTFRAGHNDLVPELRERLCKRTFRAGHNELMSELRKRDDEVEETSLGSPQGGDGIDP
jgi:hypothetical protein